MNTKPRDGSGVRTHDGERRGSGRPVVALSPRTRAAFTLVEMLVALGVLVLVLLMVAQVFGITTRTAAQSVAFAESSERLRTLMIEIERDLDACNPQESVLVIRGRTVPAALTAEDLAARRFYRELVGDPAAVPAGYNPQTAAAKNLNSNFSEPRADILMFFTNRPTASGAPPTNPTNAAQRLYANGGVSTPIQVVYGHAALDRAVRSGANSFAYANSLQHVGELRSDGTLRSELPASRWHLARRAVILESSTRPSDITLSNLLPSNWGPTKVSLLAGWPIAKSAGDVVAFNLPEYLARFGSYDADRLAEHSPYQAKGGAEVPGKGATNSVYATARSLIDDVLYAPGSAAGANPALHVATVVERPPAALASNLGVHGLPGCVWFQVEVLIPEDPRNSPYGIDGTQWNDTARWVEVPDGATFVFVPDSEENRGLIARQPINGPGRIDDFAWVAAGPSPGPALFNISNKRIRMWPYAVRITLRAVDPQNRLDAPIVRSIVHQFD